MKNIIYNYDPFIWPLLVVSVVLAVRLYYQRHPGKYRTQFLRLTTGLPLNIIYGVTVVSLIGLVAFESYYIFTQCRVSTRYLNETLAATKTVISVFNQLGVPYWFDYATLLYVLRNSGYNIWDHDQDISVMHPGIERVNSWMKIFESSGVYPEFDESRDLLQIWSSKRRGPHVDIWLWMPDSDEGKDLIVTKDYTVIYRWREKSHIFPLKEAEWLGVNVTIPNDPHAISAREFAVYGGGPRAYMTPVVLRADCFHNLFNGRLFY